MKAITEQNTLTLFPEGRIDTNNAEQIENELFAALDSCAENVKEIVMDAARLTYISSAGLRVLMKLRKKLNHPLPIRNVSRDVYEIFETTGFTELFNVQKALRNVSVEGCEEIGSGGYGTVYRLDAETILKVYNMGTLEFIEQERTMSQRAFVNGLPTAIPYDTVRVGDRYGVVYEMLEAKTVAQLITADPAQKDRYVRLAAAALRKFHTVELHDKAFQDKKKMFQEMAENCKPYLSAEDAQMLIGYVDSIPDRCTFVHGDYNFKNVMVKDGEIMLIDIGDACIGHPIFDLGGVLLSCTFARSTLRPPEEIRRLLGFDPALADEVWKSFCSEYFETNDPAEIERRTQMLMPMTKLTIAHHSLRRIHAADEATFRARVEMHIQNGFLPALRNAPELDF